MQISRKYFWIIIISFVYSQNESIKLSLDTFGQSEYYLNELNPFYQSSLSLGAVHISPVDGVPQGSSDMIFDFIDSVDSSAVTSQFNYSRGNDSFRETKILANNFIAKNKKILFKAHGRKYPGIGSRSSFDNYESFGEGYILQNFLIDYMSFYDQYSLRLTKYHHKEDTGIPIDNIQNTRLVQIDGLGISFDVNSYNGFFKSQYALGLNYYNNFHHIEHIGQNYDNHEYGFGIDYSIHFNKNMQSLMNLDYKQISRQGEDMFALNYSKYGFLYTSSGSAFKIGLDWVNANSDILDSKGSLFFDFRWNFSDEWNLNIKRDRSFSDLTSPASKIFNQYNLLSAEFRSAKTGFSIDYYNIDDIIYDGRNQDNNSLIKLNIRFGNQELIKLHHDKNILLDMLAMSFSYYNYFDYSPVKSNLSYQFYFKYLDMYDSRKYLPYFNFQIQRIDFNQGYGPSLSSNPISYLEDSNSSFEYITSKLELGISFDTFIISYHILNPGRIATYDENGLAVTDNQYYFPVDLTDIQTPIYQMNYITLRWQFSDY